MKKKIFVMLLMVMAVTFVGCGTKDDSNASDASSSVESTVQEEGVEESVVPESSEEEESVEESVVPESSEEESAEAAENTALSILQNIWATYEDENKFAVGGGDSSNMMMDAPGAFDAANTEELDVTLGFPAAHVDKIDDAASLMHMMNANTFTAGVYHVTDAANVQAVCDGLKENIMNRQWMCGFPDTLMILSIDGNYVMSAFGNAEVIETFKNKTISAYENANILYEESLNF